MTVPLALRIFMLFLLTLVSLLPASVSLASARAVEQVGTSQEGPSESQLCRNLIVEAPQGQEELLSFDENEMRLLCGDPDVKDWSSIPFNQKQFFLRGFLQSRGFHSPRFTEENGGQEKVLRVQPGPLLKLSKVTWTGVGASRLPENRRLNQQVLTPALLDEIEKWTAGRLLEESFPCTEVKTRANQETGEVTVEIQERRSTSNRSVPPEVAQIAVHPPSGLRPEAIRSSFVIQLARPFDGIALRLSEVRAKETFGLLSSYFLVGCRGDVLGLRHESTQGARALIAFGLGIDTEGILSFRTRFVNKGLDEWGSRFQASLQMSFLEQRLEALWRKLPFGNAGNGFWQTRGTLTRIDDPILESWGATLSSGPGWLHVGSRTSLTTHIFPQLTLERVLRGQAALESQGFEWIFQQIWQSFEHELYQREPKEGHILRGEIAGAHPAFFSSYRALRVDIEGQLLSNVFATDPPSVVFGIRGRISHTLTEEAGLTALPSHFLYHLGGAQDLRGFSRKELPYGTPADFRWMLSAEARHVVVPWEWAQPFVFVDGGQVAVKDELTRAPLFWSPGLGMRLSTPIGSFRGSLAWAKAAGGEAQARPERFQRTSPLSRLQFYLSYGEEF